MLIVPPDGGEWALATGALACPVCAHKLVRHGYGAPRTIRGLGGRTERFRPRRARCHGCGRTHILLPTGYLPRRADNIEVIGTALVARASGDSYDTIAIKVARPRSTVRSWFRALPQTQVEWLYRQGATTRVTLAVDQAGLGVHPPLTHSLLRRALDQLSYTVAAFHQQFGTGEKAWDLIGWWTQGNLLAPPDARSENIAVLL